MKFAKIMSLVMTVCLLVCSLAACGGKDGDGADTTAATVAQGTEVTVNMTVIVKDANDKEVNRAAVSYTGINPTAGDIIEKYCSDNDLDFDTNDDGAIVTIGDLTAATGQFWAGYYEDQGKAKEFSSLATQVVQDGKKIVVYLAGTAATTNAVE